MRLSQKLDALQAMAIVHAGKMHKLYLIQLLAEHAQDDEMTMEFLAWTDELLR
ncbi:MAG: hypothetical protein FWD06_00215 [Oscillospiraceae bacterium]|nr:hypothetical protein [Oscillospiraceae bacterium]